jgi:hypothetical protein
MPWMALEQPRRGVMQERQEHAVRLGEVERGFERARGSTPVADGLAYDRLQQEVLDCPDGGRLWPAGCALERRERARGALAVVLSKSQHRERFAHRYRFAFIPVELSEGPFHALEVAQPDQGLQPERPDPRREQVGCDKQLAHALGCFERA